MCITCFVHFFARTEETAYLSDCAQHFHRARNLERGKTLPLAMTGCRHEGRRRGAFVLLSSRRWVDQSWTHHHHRPNAPSLNPFDKQPRTQSWELHIVGKWVAIFPAGSKRNRNFTRVEARSGFSRSTDRLSRIPTVLVGRCRSFVWPGPQYGVTQCKYFDRPWA